MMIANLKYLFIFLFLTGLIFFSCKKAQPVQSNATINQANNTPVNITILISSHPNLIATGGVDTVSNAGIKGILIYRASTTQFYAYERSCTYDGTTVANAKVSASNGSFTAKDNICGSMFVIGDGTGSVSHGPATFALKQYVTSFDGTNILHITN